MVIIKSLNTLKRSVAAEVKALKISLLCTNQFHSNAEIELLDLSIDMDASKCLHGGLSHGLDTWPGFPYV